MKNKKSYLIVCVLVIFFIGIIVYVFTKDKKTTTEYSNQTSDSIDMSMDFTDEDIDWSNYESKDYTLTKSITITTAGVYNLTGTIDDGVVTINTKGNVKLVLNNVNITNSKGPAIYVKDADTVVIETSSGSTNYLEDSETYSGYDTDEIGTIFSHNDISFEGKGTLVVKSNNEDAIVGKDALKIVSGTYEITAKDDGIRGKDYVYIKNGKFKITSSGDAIKSTNDTDSTKGYVLIENGTFDINATLDGIQAETKLLIKDGIFNIITGGGSVNASTKEEWGHWGSSSSTDSESAKGIKAGDNLFIENGTINIDSSDDSMHSNNYIGIKAGTITLSSGDDGIHADTELIIDSGNINIEKSYEGLESSKMTINNGEISVTSSDDGINVAGGNDSSAMGRPGANNFSSNTSNILTINGGSIYVDADGDGIDVNGSAYINGANITVDGPSNGGNGALDYDQEFVINGGTLVAGGASGMAQGASSSSKVYNLLVNFTSTYSSGDKITIEDSNNKEIISYESAKSYSTLVVSSPKLENGKSYTIKVNGSEYKTFTISSITTTIGNSSNNRNMGNMGGGPKGRR